MDRTWPPAGRLSSQVRWNDKYFYVPLGRSGNIIYKFFLLGLSTVTVWGCILNLGSFSQQATKRLKTMTICYAMAQQANPSFLLTSYQLQLWQRI